MSEGAGFGLNIAEKMFGFILLVIGILTAYFTFTSTAELSAFLWFFGVLSIIVIIVGLILLTAKTE